MRDENFDPKTLTPEEYETWKQSVIQSATAFYNDVKDDEWFYLATAAHIEIFRNALHDILIVCGVNLSAPEEDVLTIRFGPGFDPSVLQVGNKLNLPKFGPSTIETSECNSPGFYTVGVLTSELKRATVIFQSIADGEKSDIVN